MRKLTKSMESALWQHYAPEAYMAVRKVYGYVKTNVSTDAALVARGLILAGNEITKVDQSRLTGKGAAWISERLESNRADALREHWGRETAISAPRGQDALRLACLCGQMLGVTFLARDEEAAYDDLCSRHGYPRRPGGCPRCNLGEATPAVNADGCPVNGPCDPCDAATRHAADATEPVICDTYGCDKDATHAVALRFDDLWDYSNQCADDTARIRRDPSFHAARPLDVSERFRVADVDHLGGIDDNDEAQLIASCLRSQAKADAESAAAESAAIARAAASASRARVLDIVNGIDHNALAKTLHGRVASGWTADDCNHVPPMAGCWCALLAMTDVSLFTPVPAPDPIVVEPMCAAMDHPCAGRVTTSLTCCGTPVCSAHAADTIDGPCPACGSVMTTVLAVYDSRVPQVPASRTAPEDVRAASPVRYGVTVEWWDDAHGIARTAVIGGHETWEVAVAEMARIKRMERFDRVTGTIALYATLEDF